MVLIFVPKMFGGLELVPMTLTFILDFNFFFFSFGTLDNCAPRFSVLTFDCCLMSSITVLITRY